LHSDKAASAAATVTATVTGTPMTGTANRSLTRSQKVQKVTRKNMLILGADPMNQNLFGSAKNKS